jgi:hypothetical protein
MKKIISFSLWGNDPKYTIGAVKNALLTEQIYPGWISRFYVGQSVPNYIIETLQSINNVEVVLMNEYGNWIGMFWRFYACDDADIMLSRDTDSRLSVREKLAVDEWLNSDKNFHIMRDHPLHTTEILGGMWGCRNGILKGIKKTIDEYTKGDFWQVDQNFLKEKIYPMVINDSFIHDSFLSYNDNKKPFPSERMEQEFVGDVFDQYDQRHPEFYKLIN